LKKMSKIVHFRLAMKTSKPTMVQQQHLAARKYLVNFQMCFKISWSLEHILPALCFTGQFCCLFLTNQYKIR